MSLRSALGLLLTLAPLTFAGCGQSSAPEFRLNAPLLVQARIGEQDQQWIANTLTAMFGSPDQPLAPPGTSLDEAKLQVAAGPVWSDQVGTKHGLYRQHCAHCHGVTGGGLGPTAAFLNPYPRDYRPGVFKFKSTERAARPTDDDLHRILYEGVAGTAMPSFKLLPDSDRDALVEYVKYLSMRGQLEAAIAVYIQFEIDEDDYGNPLPFNPDEHPDQLVAVQEMLAGIVDEWDAAGEAVVLPDEESLPTDDQTDEQLAATIDHGRDLFFGKGGCVKCHGTLALGDGQRTDFSDWNKATKAFLDGSAGFVEEMQNQIAELEEAEPETEEEAQVNERVIEDSYYLMAQHKALEEHVLQPRNIIPRNLRANVYRGGRRPLDLFWRVSQGIAGTPMPAAPSGLTQDDLWAIVAYVQSLPYEAASRPQVPLPVNERTLP